MRPLFLYLNNQPLLCRLDMRSHGVGLVGDLLIMGDDDDSAAPVWKSLRYA